MPRSFETKLPSPYLKKIIALPEKFEDPKAYPFNLPWLKHQEFELEFSTPITIIVGENGTGKSTLIEAIASLCGYDEAGGGKGYMPLDHTGAVDKSGADLANALRPHWLPKVTSGWFFRAESFFSVARYLDTAALDAGAAPPDFLSWSHGEGFLRFFEQRCTFPGIYFMDEPESALSPKRQMELLKIFAKIHASQKTQVIMATHSPILMAFPHARLLEITRFGLEEVDFTQTSHFKLYRDFVLDPDGFVLGALMEEEDTN